MGAPHTVTVMLLLIMIIASPVRVPALVVIVGFIRAIVPMAVLAPIRSLRLRGVVLAVVLVVAVVWAPIGVAALIVAVALVGAVILVVVLVGT